MASKASNGNGAVTDVQLLNGASVPASANGDVSPDAHVVRRSEVMEALWPARVPSPVTATASDESVDVGALARVIARGWRILLLGAITGVLVGGAIAVFFPPRYRGVASVLVRNANDPAGSILSKIGVAGDLAGAAAGGSLGGALTSPLETELQLLESRDLLGRVVDSLALQARVFSPRGVPARALFRSGPIRGDFRHRDVAFTRAVDGTYRAQDADGAAATLTQGRRGEIPGVGPVTLVEGPLPPQFDVRFSDREDAITEIGGRLTVEKKGGELVEVRYTGPDSVTAAAVPNAVIAAYLEQRRTVDRGLNQRRYEFMAAQADSAAQQLATAEDALRREQESSGVLDAEATGKSGLEAIQQVRTELVGLDAERQAAHSLVNAVERGALSPRELAAFPAFLRAPAINSILSQITTLETERTRLLGVRTERDPDVSVLSRSISDLERGLLPLATTYAGALDRQVGELAGEQHAVETRLEALPRQAEGGLRRQRDVKRLSQTVLGLQAQMIDARLSALSEGGQVRVVDAATAPKRPLFPRPLYTVPVGLLLGLLGASAVVLARGAWSSRVYTTADAERASGLPVVEFQRGEPLLLGAGRRHGTLLVVGVNASAPIQSVTDVLIAQARTRRQEVVGIDASAVAQTANRTSDPSGAGDALERAEAEYEAVYVTAPPVTDARTAALLDVHRAVAVVARAGVTTRHELADATRTLARLGVPVVGVVLAASDAS